MESNSKLELVKGFFRKHFCQIFGLVVKSVILQFRQYLTNIVQLLFPIVVLLFIYILQLIFNSVSPLSSPVYVNPPASELTPLLALLSENSTVFPPDKFLYSSNSNVNNFTLGFLTVNGTGAGLLGQISLGPSGQLPVVDPITNTSRYVPYFEFYDYGTSSFNSIFYNDLNPFNNVNTSNVRVPLGAYFFKELQMSPSNNISLYYEIQYDNATLTTFCNEIAEIASCSGLLPSSMLNYINQAFIHNITQTTQNVGQIVTANSQQMPYTTTPQQIQLANVLGGFFFPLVLTFLLPVFLYTLVLEKQGKLKEMMRLSGLSVIHYFTVTYVIDYIFYLLVLAIFLIMSAIFQLRYLTGTNFLIIFLGFFGWGLSLVSWAFFLSAFIENTLVAVVVGYLLSIFGVVSGIILETEVFVKGNYYYKIALLVNPWAIVELCQTLSSECNQYHCPQIGSLVDDVEVQMSIVFIFANAIIYLVLGLYFDAVLPSTWGVRQSIFFPITWPIKKIFGLCCKKKRSNDGSYTKENLEMTEQEDEVVINERNLVLSHQRNPDNSPILLWHLCKSYSFGKLAVNDLTIAMIPGECFGLLGPNGSG